MHLQSYTPSAAHGDSRMYDIKQLKPLEREHVEKIADEVRRQVSMYWSMWGKPMHYRDVFARFSQRLPKGMILLEFVSYCTSNEYVHVGISTQGKRYVFPSLDAAKLTADDIIEQIIELERIARARKAANRRAARPNKI